MSIWNLASIGFDYFSNKDKQKKIDEKVKKAEKEKKRVEAKNKKMIKDEQNFKKNLESERKNLDVAVDKNKDSEANGMDDVVADFSKDDKKKTKMLQSIRKYGR